MAFRRMHFGGQPSRGPPNTGNNPDMFSESYIETIEYGMDSILQIAKSILPVSTPAQRIEHVESMKKQFKKLVKAMIIAEDAEEIVDKVAMEVGGKDYDPTDGGKNKRSASSSNGQSTDSEVAANAIIAPAMTVTERIASESKRQLKAFEESIQDHTIERHPRYLEFLNAINKITSKGDEDSDDDESVNDEAQGMEADSDDDNDGSSVSGGTDGGEDVEGVPVQAIPQLDPITKKPLTDPVRNRICQHIYGKAAILQLILSSDKVRCPTMGCGNPNPLRVSDLIIDEQLTKEVTKNRKKDRKAGN